ncbi:MAG: hydroxysqualene dehydroxylase, partial [Candidatus Acidiferrales bacterium]
LAGEKVAAAVLDGGGELHADYFVCAVPHPAFLQLLPPALVEREPAFAGVRNLDISPITGVHFWLDRPVMREPFLTLLGRATQWIFNKTLLSRVAPAGPGAGQYLQLVISASYDLVPLPRRQIIDLCLRELHDALPESRQAQLQKSTVIKEVSATFSPRPGCDRWRPSQGTALNNFFLAGDWTRTGWPATMEGAVRSGYLAAEAILAAEGNHCRLLVPDLPAEGLARL